MKKMRRKKEKNEVRSKKRKIARGFRRLPSSRSENFQLDAALAQ